MHKKLAAELDSLAHSILQMKNKENVFLLQKKAHEVYEKLSILAYIEEYVNSTPQATETKEELITKIEEIEATKETELTQDKVEEDTVTVEKNVNSTPQATETKEELTPKIEEIETTKEAELTQDKTEEVSTVIEEDETPIDNFANEVAENVIEEIEKEDITTQIVEEITEQPFDELEETIFGDDNTKFDETSFVEESKTPTLEDELKDTVSVDVTADLFTKVEPKKSLNDFLQQSVQIGLNDRIAFVTHLFKGNQADYNRVISQLNTFDSHKEAIKFINKKVKPDYDWSNKEEYETRLLEIIERKFA